MTSSAGDTGQKRPHPILVAAEAPRAAVELVWFGTSRLLLSRAPHGDGHRVLVLPGLLASDRSTVPMRDLLGELGYRVLGFELGQNVPSRDLLARLQARLQDLRARDGRPISIVGWSLGGIYARRIAREAPDWVRLVISLGSPFRPVPREASVAPGARVAGHTGVGAPRPPTSRGHDRPLPVPSTSIFSRTDGIVPWRSCLNTAGGSHETLEVIGSHCGLGHHPAVLWAIADRLAQPAGSWKPIQIPPPLRPALRHHRGA